MKKLIELNIALSGSELAAEFCNLDEIEQAAFFNAIAKDAEAWQNHFDLQMAAVERTGLLTKEGRSIMRIIGQFADIPAYEATKRLKAKVTTNFGLLEMKPPAEQPQAQIFRFECEMNLAIESLKALRQIMEESNGMGMKITIEPNER